MKILLRQPTRNLYFQGLQKWTGDPEQAFDFKFIDRALAFVETWDLEGVELAFAFDDPKQVTSVSVGKLATRNKAAA